MDPVEFRRIMGHWTTGVSVVATMTLDGHPRGLTANAVASVSLDPMLVLVCVERASETHAAIRDAGCFAISILAEDDETTARRFAGDAAPDKFTGVAWRTEQTGAPVLDGALAWLDCTIHDTCDGGDHTIYVGLVEAGGATDDAPLLYYRGGYAGLRR